MSNRVNQLLHNRRIMTTGVIVNLRPVYYKRNRKKRGIKYNIFIKTPHKAVIRNGVAQIYISLRGNWDRWHSYKILYHTKTPINVSGYRICNRFGEWEWKDYNGNHGTEKQFIILLKDDPPPSLICTKTIDEIFKDYNYYEIHKKKRVRV